MILFLTSSPTGDLDGKYICDGLDNRNGFLDDLKGYWKCNSKVMMIAADPYNYEGNDEMGNFFHNALLRSELSVSEFVLVDDRNCYFDKEELNGYDVILLGGGHVPTQNRFFKEIDLRNKIKGFEGIVIGISAGTMNCADSVYAQPELDGEAIDPYYERFIEGLGLTTINVCPHYQIVKDKYLDGMHLFYEISCKDAGDKALIALVDGSYLKKTKDFTIIKGEAYKLFKDRIERI